MQTSKKYLCCKNCFRKNERYRIQFISRIMRIEVAMQRKVVGTQHMKSCFFETQHETFSQKKMLRKTTLFM